MTPLFSDRDAAGKAIALALGNRFQGRDVLVLGLPRGGVPVARAVAEALGAPLDVVVARKLGVPGMREVAFGAIAEGSDDVVEDAVRWYLGIPGGVVRKVVERERQELERRRRLYRGGLGLPDVRGRTVIIVDDGLASGATLRAAARVVRGGRPARLIAAVPVASAVHCDDVRAMVDELIVVATPEPFETVSVWYEDFSPVSDAEVLRLLGREAVVAFEVEDPDEHDVVIPIARHDHVMVGTLGLPNGCPAGLAIFAHGGGSSRNSYRNRYLAGCIRDAGWATLRLDLLLESEQTEDVDGTVRFDISRIAGRLAGTVEWAVREHVPGAERIVLVGASTGAAAAMVVAANRPDLITGVASRGGRIDLAGASLAGVRAPVLMVVGDADVDTLKLTREFAADLACPNRLAIVRGAGHTFDEPGSLGSVGEHIVRWLDRRRAGRFAWNPTAFARRLRLARI